MSYFSGQYHTKMDAKGRLVLPARLRSKLPAESSEVLVLVKGMEPCISVYPIKEWEVFIQKVVGLSDFVQEHRQLQRSLLSRSMEVELDALSRFVMPKSLIDYARIAQDVVMVGVGSKMEIWSEELWNAQPLKDPEELSIVAERILSQSSPN